MKQICDTEQNKIFLDLGNQEGVRKSYVEKGNEKNNASNEQTAGKEDISNDGSTAHRVQAEVLFLGIGQ